MNLDTPLFGRLTVSGKRITLGRGTISTLMIRAVEQVKQIRLSEDGVIQIEISKAKLQDATTFDKYSILEQQVAAQTMTNPDDESPFPGITIGRVAEVMVTPEYEAYEKICDPARRVGITSFDMEMIRDSYVSKFPDCAQHFPKWIDK